MSHVGYLFGVAVESAFVSRAFVPLVFEADAHAGFEAHGAVVVGGFVCWFAGVLPTCVDVFEVFDVYMPVWTILRPPVGAGGKPVVRASGVLPPGRVGGVKDLL